MGDDTKLDKKARSLDLPIHIGKVLPTPSAGEQHEKRVSISAENLEFIRKKVLEIRAYIESIDTLKQLSVGQEGENLSQNLIEKLHSIDNRLTKTETIVQEVNTKLDKMDTKLDNVSSKDFVENHINQAQNSLLKWMIGTGIALAAVIIALIKFFV